ncbi:hypothetical protein V8E53_008831 [Lactarius tabidus]
MSLPGPDSAESIRAVLMGTSEEFKDFYDNEQLVTEVLVHEVLNNIIGLNREKLREVDNRYCLHDLLSAMLLHAPHPLGQRYVAVCLRIAHQKGEDGVVNAAKCWQSQKLDLESSSSQTPSIDISEPSTSQKSEPSLRAQVAHREQYRCAITKAFDKARSDKLAKEGRFDEIPDDAQVDMHAALVIPFLLNEFDDKFINRPKIMDAARTWDMLRSWTRIDFMPLVRSDINLPANAIYMTSTEHRTFGQFKLYLDKEAYPDIPNKYRESTVEPPNPTYLKAHAAFAKVLHLSGASQ